MIIKRILTAIAFCLCSQIMLALEPSGTLPVIYINTENNAEIVSKEDYLNATYWLDPNGADDVEALGSKNSPLELQIKGRGNYTWTSFDKKPYKMKLGSKTSILGMPKHKHYTLMAHADDNLSFMRNASGLQLSRIAGLNWTPNDAPIELVINGDYKGIYFLTEQIKIDKNRLDITEMNDLATDDVTGGWLVEIDNYDTDPHVYVTEGNGHKIIFTYKSPEELSTQQEKYLTDQMTLLNNTIFGNKNSDNLWKILDLDQAARYYIVQELMDDTESYHGSCYLYKDKGENEKWKFGPVWDFGNAFQRGSKHKFVWQDPLFNQVWIGEIYKYPAFQEKVKEVWKEICDNGLAGISEYLENLANKCNKAAKQSNKRWPQYGNANMIAGMSTIISNLNKSAIWLGKQWGYDAPLIEKNTQVYVRGTFNNWGLNSAMYHNSDGTWTFENINLCKDDYFKIASEDWTTVDYGADPKNAEIRPNEVFPLVKIGQNIKLPTDVSGYNLIFNPENETLLLTKEDYSAIQKIENNSTDTEIYTISGARVKNMHSPGIYILRQGGKTRKVVK